MNFDINPVLAAAATALTVVGVVYKVLLTPNLDRRYVVRNECVEKHKVNANVPNDIATIKADLAVMKNELEWIKQAIMKQIR